MPGNFPKLAHSVRILKSDGNRLLMEVEAASFGRLFPRVVVSVEAELLDGSGYRCVTSNRALGTSGEEELLLRDAPEGTQLDYTYAVTLNRRWLCPVFGCLVRAFALPYWKRNYLARLTILAQEHHRKLLASNAAEQAIATPPGPEHVDGNDA
jgi:hypothetical protein